MEEALADLGKRSSEDADLEEGLWQNCLEHEHDDSANQKRQDAKQLVDKSVARWVPGSPVLVTVYLHHFSQFHIFSGGSTPTPPLGDSPPYPLKTF